MEFEDALVEYFYDVLHKLYTEGNKINNIYKHQETYLTKVNEYKKKAKEGFSSESEKKNMELEVAKAKKTADSDRKQLEKYSNLDADNPIAKVNKSIERKYNADSLTKKAAAVDYSVEVNGNKYIAQQFSKLSRSERKIVSRILTIITDNAPKNVAEELVNKIKEELK